MKNILNSELSRGAILLYQHIYSLAKKEGYCFATNPYLEKAMNCSHTSIKGWLNELEKADFIFRENVYLEGKKRVESRKIYLKFDRQVDRQVDRSDRQPGLPDTIVLLDSTNYSKEYLIKESYNSLSSTPRASAQDDNDSFLNDFLSEQAKVLEDHVRSNAHSALKGILNTLDSLDEDDSYGIMMANIDLSRENAKKAKEESLTSLESHYDSSYEKMMVNIQRSIANSKKHQSKVDEIRGCKPLEYIPTDQERWAEEQEGIAREACESFLNTLLEIWNGIIQDKEDCLFQIFKLSELNRLEAEVALKGRVKLNNWLVGGKTITSIDDFLKHQVKKSEEEWLGIL